MSSSSFFRPSSAFLFLLAGIELAQATPAPQGGPMSGGSGDNSTVSETAPSSPPTGQSVPPPEFGGHHKLGDGVIAAIVVCTSVLIVSLAVLLILSIRRRRRRAEARSRVVDSLPVSWGLSGTDGDVPPPSPAMSKPMHPQMAQVRRGGNQHRRAESGDAPVLEGLMSMGGGKGGHQSKTSQSSVAPLLLGRDRFRAEPLPASNFLPRDRTLPSSGLRNSSMDKDRDGDWDPTESAPSSPSSEDSFRSARSSDEYAYRPMVPPPALFLDTNTANTHGRGGFLTTPTGGALLSTASPETARPMDAPPSLPMPVPGVAVTDDSGRTLGLTPAPQRGGNTSQRDLPSALSRPGPHTAHGNGSKPSLSSLSMSFAYDGSPLPTAAERQQEQGRNGHPATLRSAGPKDGGTDWEALTFEH